GIGGRSGRPTPSYRPFRRASIKVFSVHLPIPVSGSGVRFAVKLVPHGPENAVIPPDPAQTQDPCPSAGAGATASFSGCPDSIRVRSGSGPFGPSTWGVWQS